jgi:hypothetical protein
MRQTVVGTNMRQTVIIVLIINFLIITVSAIDDGGDGLHGVNVCLPCHDSILPESSAKIIYDECKCHYPTEDPVWHNEIDIQSVKKIHGNQVCIKCHVNSIAITNKENLHDVHSATECENCHGSKNVIRPSFLDCFSCHEKEIHGVHNDLEGLCIICHGKFGEESIQKFTSANVPVSADIYTIPEKKPFPTVIEFLRSFSQWIKF